MSDSFSIDFSEVNQLSAALDRVPATAGKYLRSAIEFTSKEIDKDWTKEAQGMEHAPAFPHSITYDVSVLHGFGSSVLKSDIGPDKERPQGALGNLIEYGSIHNPPQGLGHGALQRNEADFIKGLGIALAQAEHDAGVDVSAVASAGAVIRGSYR